MDGKALTPGAGYWMMGAEGRSGFRIARALDTAHRIPGSPHPITPTVFLSIIIPTLNEVRSITAILGDLRGLPVPHEVIVVDGGSTDGTQTRARQLGATLVETEAGRGIQLAAGAAAAKGTILCFLHADVRLDKDSVITLFETVSKPVEEAYVFQLAIAAEGMLHRLIEWGTGLRTRVLGLPYGDQGLIVSRRHYEAAGGYPPLPVMEDVAFIRALRRVTKIRVLDDALQVSPRRWEREGAIRGMLRNWLLLVAFTLRVPVSFLARRYRPSGDLPSGA